MDADFSHNPDDLIKLYHACKSGEGDMAIGSRYVTGVNVVNWPMGRVLMSYFASKYVRFITGMKIHDATAGFVCYTRKVLEAIDLDNIRFKGYAFQIEIHGMDHGIQAERSSYHLHRPYPRYIQNEWWHLQRSLLGSYHDETPEPGKT